ncbi:MAG: ferredoxin [Candidatus Nanoarchaeia archaeon]|nr:ferredoxin [Candidatus Nanoarchaeia archaeon]MDD5053972.1 ferredoxin [Candidatus Nanoarchaeia archaeon]MDD5499641.1 ferredoxin [Candidatus Nanoarchaeia archaeon]
MKYKILYDRIKCEDNLVCVAECPKLWKLNSSTGKVSLKGSKETKLGSKIFELVIEKKDLNACRKAEAGCPKGAIKINELKE